MLDRQVVPISFTQGVDTKTDEKLVIPGRLTLLENGIFTSGGKIKKRPGYNALSTQVLGGGSLSVGQGLYTYQDELLQFSGQKIFSYSSATSRWVDKGPAYSVNVTAETVFKNSYEQLDPSLAVAKNVGVYAWQDSRGDLRINVYDTLTNMTYLQDYILDASNTSAKPKCVACNDFLFILFVDGTNLKSIRIDPALPTTVGTATIIGNDLNAVAYFDVDVISTKMVVAYHAASNNISVKYLLSSNIVGNPSNGQPSPVSVADGVVNKRHICVKIRQSDGVIFVYYDKDQRYVNFFALYADFTTASVVTTIYDNGASAPFVYNITAGNLASSDQNVYWGRRAVNPRHVFTQVATVNTTGVVTATSVFVRSVVPYAKAFEINNLIYLLCVYQSDIQGTYFLLDSNGTLVAKCCPGVASNISEHLSTWYQSGSLFSAVISYKAKFTADNTTLQFLDGLKLASFDLTADQNFYAKSLGETLYISGGYLSQYDGFSLTEANFHLYPEDVSVQVANNGGGLSPGTYQVVCCYEWDNNKGEVERSAPSLAVTFNGGNTHLPTYTVNTLRLTLKKAPDRTNVRLVFYRTTANGTLFYRVTSIAAPTFNDPSVDTISYADTLTDSAITSRDLIYTTGGVVENIAPPACQVIEVYKNRLMLSGLEDPLEVWYSREYSKNEAVNFSDVFTFQLNPLGGDIRGLKFMDDKLLIFKENLLFALAGDGPNDLGQQNNFTTPELLSSDVGCAFPNSLVLTPEGVMFKSYKGLYMVSRSLQLTYIGADVEAYNGLTVMSADLLQDKNQVRFLTKDGVCILYDYYYKQWSVFTNHQGIDADIWQGQYVYLRPNGEVYKNNDSFFKDNNIGYKLKIATAWLKFAGLQGFQRIRRVAVLGEFRSAHTLKMQVAYDYQPYWTDLIIWNAAAEIDTSVWGDDPTWGDSEAWGGDSDSVYQFRAHLRQQKCQSIKFTFEDVSQGTPGESYSLSDLSLEVGIKRGLNKLKLAKSLG